MKTSILKVVVTGGAGFIGSHMVKMLLGAGYEVAVLDDFSTGNEWAVSDCEILKVNLLDHEKLAKALHKRQFDGVIHFAANILAGRVHSNKKMTSLKSWFRI